MKSKFFLYSVAAFAFCASAPYAAADRVTTTSITQTKDMPNVNEITFSTFDIDGDGAYSMAEIGDRLFTSFDTDGNGSIDNIEWDKKNVITIVPMEKETFKFYDTDDDGIAEETTYTYETFYEASGLIKFDQNRDGLSAKEFIGGSGFEPLDVDENKLISKEEWRTAYFATLPKHTNQKEYQQ